MATPHPRSCPDTPAPPTSHRLPGLLTGALTALTLTGAALVATHRRARGWQAAAVTAQYEAGHDRLTALANRTTAMTHLHHQPVALVGLLDLDQFKAVNDRYGHRVGDLLLTTVATRLQTLMRTRGMAARLGGDEFLLVWTYLPADPVQDATTLLDVLWQPVTLDGHTLRPTASLGLAAAGPHLRGSDLVAAADAAMYAAKETGRVRVYPGTHPPLSLDRRTVRDRPPTADPDPCDPTQHVEPTIEEGDPA